MDSWMSKPGVRTPKGHGKGSRRDKSDSNKRRNVAVRDNSTAASAGAGSRELRKPLQGTPELSLQNSRLLRMLYGMGVCTSLVPTNPAVITAANIESDPSRPMEGQIQCWANLVAGLASDEKVPQEARIVLDRHRTSITHLADLLGHVLHCTVQRTFNDHNVYKV